MSAFPQLLANSVARSLRTAKHALIPGVNLRRFPRVMALFNAVERAGHLPYVDDVHGHRMYVDRNDSLRLSLFRTYGPEETAFFEREIRPGQTLVDIGANIGYFTLVFARATGPGGRVYAFEPAPENFSLLSRNVALNGYANATLEKKAVWHTTGPLALHLSEENAGDHRTAATPGRAVVEIDAVRLDDYFADRGEPVHWIKMDIQGAEGGALAGMSGLLTRNRDLTLYMELWPAGLANAGSDARTVVDRLRDFGFRFYHIEAGGRLARADIERVLERCTVANDDFTDLLCRRS